MKKTYNRIPANFWTTPEAHALRQAGPEACLVACYLLTSPHANMLGIFYLPLQYASLDCGLSVEDLSKTLVQLSALNFCHYDTTRQYIWVVDMLRYQVGLHLSMTEKQLKGLYDSCSHLPALSFMEKFYTSYAMLFDCNEDTTENTSECHPHAMRILIL